MYLPLNKSVQSILFSAGLATLAACSPESGVWQFYREAGTQVDSGEFGNASLHNQLVQTCRTNAASGGKVGTQGDAVVVLDPESTQNRKVYRVHCNGQLDGKFARVVYQDYVGSATQAQTVEAADSE